MGSGFSQNLSFVSIYANSYSVPMLGLKSLSKSLKVHQGQLPPSGFPLTFVEGWVSGIPHGEACRVKGPKQTKIWSFEGKVVHRNTNGTKIWPHSRATQLSFSFTLLCR